MVDSEFIPPLTTLGDQGNLRAALIRRVPYTFASSENPEAFVAMDGGTGSIPWALVWAGHIFYFDPNDLTTAHDGVTTIVTQDGYRYKVDGVAGEQDSVKSRSITAPPSSPALGDAYLVPTGATGDWATHPNNIALWTARGWAYIPPQVGQLVFVEAEGGFYHYGTGGAWVAGIGGSALGPSTVRASSLIGGRTHWVVVNQTTNTPPGSPANGVAYIVGPAPTGAWAGQSGRIAVYEINAWAFYVPAQGWTAYTQSLNTNFVYNGGWVPQASGYDSIQLLFTAGGIAPGQSGSSSYVYSPTTPPSASNFQVRDSQTATIQAAYAGQRFEIDYSCGFTATAIEAIFGVVIDSESNARDWQHCICATSNGVVGSARVSFTFTLGDVAPHTLSIARFTPAATLSGWSRRKLIVRRLA